MSRRLNRQNLLELARDYSLTFNRLVPENFPLSGRIILVNLALLDGLSVGELARACEMSVSTTSRVVNDLLNLKMVSVQIDPVNRRRRLVHPTERAIKIVDAVIVAIDRHVAPK